MPAFASKQARLIILMTGFMAFASIAVAGMLAVRLSRARAVLQQKLQQCECCDDIQSGRAK